MTKKQKFYKFTKPNGTSNWDNSFQYDFPNYNPKTKKWSPSTWVTEANSDKERKIACGKGLHLMKNRNPKYGFWGVGWLAEGKNLLGEDKEKARFESIRLLRPLKLEEIFHKKANLIGADLRRADLEGADLIGADLEGAYLRRADLEGADLRGADLRGADLEGADLRGAYLVGAYLVGADLIGADLRGADLEGADLRGAYLVGADLRRAYLRRADLEGVIGCSKEQLKEYEKRGAKI